MWSPPPCEGNSWRPSSGGGGAPWAAGPPPPRLPVSAAPYTCCGPAPRRPRRPAPAPQRAGGTCGGGSAATLGVCPCQGKRLATTHPTRHPHPAPFPSLRVCLKTLSALFSRQRAWMLRPRESRDAAPTTQSAPQTPGGRRGREEEPVKQRESVREQRMEGDGG